MKTEKIKWMTLENGTATRVCKQHAFIAVVRKMPYTREEYKGNKALCTSAGASEDGETSQNWDTLEGEVLNETRACKRCLAYSLKLKTD